jgi:hypothetical protein
MTRKWPLLAVTLLVLLAGCDGGSASRAPTPDPDPVTVTLSESSVTLPPGGLWGFFADVTGSENTEVTWSVQEPDGGTITDGGLYTAPLATGTFHVVATSQADPEVAAVATVTVVAPALAVHPQGGHLRTGSRRHFFADSEFGVVTAVAWSVEEVGGGTITSDGLYTAPDAVGTYHIVATSTVDAQRQATTMIEVVDSGFVAIPGLFVERDFVSDVTATLLTDGRVLIVGGLLDCVEVFTPTGCVERPFTILNSAQIYDPATRSFSYTGDLASGRYAHSATLLASGKVLVVGGFPDFCVCSTPVATAEIFDPAIGTFTLAGPPGTPRAYHTATLLSDGTVLVAGGVQGVPDLLADGSVPALASAEIYDPVTNSFSPVGDMSVPRIAHTATSLPDGTALIVGGASISVGLPSTGGISAAELYDPGTGEFLPAGTLAVPRFGHTATLLASGNVMIAGGSSFGPSAPVFAGDDPTDTAELYESATGSWSVAANLISPAAFHTANLLANGQILFAGSTATPYWASHAELYDFPPGSSAAVGSMEYEARFRHVATRLADGSVLVVGGRTGLVELFLE